MRYLRYLLPLGIFAVLVVFLYRGLSLDPRELPSTYIGKRAPDFSLPSLMDTNRTLSNKDLLGQVWILNVWASWCVSCRAEHPVLIEMAKQPQVNLYGLNYKDTLTEGRAWLAQYGDPYKDSAFDEKGKTGIDYGVTGVPETFVIDKKGSVRYKYVGPITPDAFIDTLWPLIKKLQAEPR